MEKGLIGGALLVGLFSWAPFDQHWPLLLSLKTMYSHLLDSAAMFFFTMHW